MPIILETIVKIKRKGDTPYVGVYFIATNNNKYYIYATKLP